MAWQQRNSLDEYVEFDRTRGVLVLVLHGQRSEIGDLRPQERKLLEHMAARNRDNGHLPVVCSYEELQSLFWPDISLEEAKGHLAHLVRDLRKKIEKNPHEPKVLLNVPGEGYLLNTCGDAGPEDERPFIVGPPINHPRRFFGRRREVERILRLWSGNPIQCAVVRGPKRSGKTSLLQYLRRLLTTPSGELRLGQSLDWFRDPERYRIVFVDFQDKRMRVLSQLLPYILNGLSIDAPENCTLESFLDRATRGIEFPSIVLMDELPAALRAPELDWDFWSGLRSLTTNLSRGLLGFVVTMPAWPDRKTGESLIDSPFLNILGHEFELGPFNRDEALELVQSSPLPFPEDDIEWILAESDLWPCLLQIFCNARLNALQEGDEGSGWKPQALKWAEHFRGLMRE